MADKTEEKKIPGLDRLRVLLLFPHMVTPGGALHYTVRLAGRLQCEGATVAVLTMQDDPKVSSTQPGVRVISLSGPLTSSFWYWLLFPYWQRRINRAIEVWRPDVLVPQVFPANWWSWLYKRRHPDVKLVWLCHEPSAFIHSVAWIRALKPWWKSFLARILRPILALVDISLSRQSDRVIANSRFTALEIERVYGISPDAIAYPGIDYSIPSGARQRKKREIITVARLTKFKRVDFLLKVFCELLKTYPDLTYNIVGTGEEEISLRSLAKALGLDSSVVFHGAAEGPTLTGLYRRASLLLHGSVDEPFGMSLVEAIASGTPVVAHNSGGPIEVINANCGRLISSMNVEDWAREITKYLDFLFSQEDFPERVRECARRFDWSLTLQPAIDIIAGLRAEKA